jgi:multidrug resistance efflux pump
MNRQNHSKLSKVEMLADSSKAIHTTAETAGVRASPVPAAVELRAQKTRAQWPRVMMTFVAVTFALVLAGELWWHYMRAPWTRDGRVRAETVEIASDVSGRVTDLRVIDNQVVHKGDILFIVDPDSYRFALAEAEAAVQSSKVDLENKKELAERRKRLDTGAVISKEELQTYANSAAQAAATYQQALAARDVAKLNMSRTTVSSPANGYVTNLHLRVGDYAMAGASKLSVLDSDSFWVAGYFEETKLPRIQVGHFARIKLMGVGPDIEGHVESISSGIADPNAGGTGAGLANVDPIFTWVRLAQRIPVRIHMDRIPQGVKVVAGQTCTVVVTAPKEP